MVLPMWNAPRAKAWLTLPFALGGGQTWTRHL